MDTRARINEILEVLYTPEEAQKWWTSPQPLLGCGTPLELEEEGRLDEALRILECLESGAYI